MPDLNELNPIGIVTYKLDLENKEKSNNAKKYNKIVVFFSYLLYNSSNTLYKEKELKKCLL